MSVYLKQCISYEKQTLIALLKKRYSYVIILTDFTIQQKMQ